MSFAGSPPYLVGTITMASAELLPLGLDATALLGSGQTVTAPVATLVNAATGAPVSGAGTPTVSGNVVTVPVGPLAVGYYTLRVTFTPSPVSVTGETVDMDLRITVPS